MKNPSQQPELHKAVQDLVPPGSMRERLLHLLNRMETLERATMKKDCTSFASMKKYRALSAEFDAELQAHRESHTVKDSQ